MLSFGKHRSTSAFCLVVFGLFLVFSSPLHAGKNYTDYETGYRIKSHTKKYFNEKYTVTTFAFSKASKTTPSVTLTYKAYFFDTLHVEDLLPKALLTRAVKMAYKDLTLKNVLFVSLQSPNEVHSKRTYGQPYVVTVTKDDIPDEILNKVEWEDFKVTATIDADGTTYGGAFKGYFDEAHNGMFTSMFTSLGVSVQSFVVHGSSKKYDPFLVVDSGKVEKMQFGERIKDKDKEANAKYLKSIGLTMEIPEIKLPVIGDFATLKNVALGMQSGLYELSPWKELPEAFKEKASGADLDVYITAESVIKIGDYQHKGAVLLDLQQSEGEDAFTMLSFSQDENIFNSLKLNKLASLPKMDLTTTGAYKIRIAQEKKDKEKQDNKDAKDKSQISLSAVGEARIGGKKVDLTAKFTIKDTGIYLDFVDVTDTFTLADLAPRIPKAKEFALKEIKLYPPFDPDVEPGIEATTEFFGMENDLFLFQHQGNDILAVDVSAKGGLSFNLAKLTDKLKKGALSSKVTGHLKGFGVGKGAVIFSKNPLELTPGKLKAGVAKALFTKILGKRATPIRLNKVTFVSDFDVNAAGDIGGLLKDGSGGVGLGLSDDTYILGSVQGIFGDEPFNMLLELKQDETFDISKLNLKLPAAFNHVKPSGVSVQEGVFIKVVDGSAEAALSTGFGLTVEGTTIAFDGSYGVQLDEDSLGLSITGACEDTIPNFAGIKGFEVNGVKVTATIGTDVTCGLEIDTSFLGRTMQNSADLTFAVKGYPKGFGWKTTVSKLDKAGWELVNYSTILNAPTFAFGGLGAITGAGVFGIIGAIAGNPEGDVAGGAAGAPFAGVGAAPGAVLGGLVSSALVGGAGVVLGGAVCGIAGAAGGFATGAIGDAIIGNTKAGKEGMDKLTGLEANILKADAVYLSFATANAASAELGIPKGVHFNMDNIQLFDTHVANFKPNFSGIYTLAQNITKDVDKTEHFIDAMKKDFEDAEKRYAKELKEKAEQYKRRYGKDWKQALAKDVLAGFAFTEKELEAAKKYAKVIAKIYNKIMAVVHYELGLVKEKPRQIEYKLTAELKKSISDLKTFMNGAVLTDEKFGPIDIAKAQITLVPSFVASADVKLFNQFEDKVDIRFNDDNKLAFASSIDTKTFGKMQSEFILQSDHQVEILGKFAATGAMEKWLEAKMENDVSLLLKDSTDIFSGLEQSLDRLQKEIDALKSEITKEGDKAASYIENSKEVQYAKKAWDKAKNDYDNAISKCKSYRTCLVNIGHHHHGCSHPCDDLYELIKGEVSKIVSLVNKYGKKLHISHISNPSYKKQAWEDAKKNVDVSTFNAKVAEYKSDKTEKTSEHQETQDQIDSAGGDVFNTFAQQVRSAIGAADIAGHFTIESIDFAATLDAVKPADTIYLMRIKYRLFDKDRTDYALFKPFDLKFNQAAFAVFSINAFEHILKTAAKDKTLGPSLQWVLNNVNDNVKQLENFMGENISQKDEAKFKQAIDSFVNGTQNVRLASQAYQKAYFAGITDITAVDLMPDSKTFNNRYIAVAHSTLCLGVASNGIDVFQEDCKDIKTEQWSAEPILDIDKNPTGYVRLKSNGLCLKAATKDNKDSGLALKLAQCNAKDTHEQWKILSKDGIFDKIVNKYSQKCLHFDTANTNPKTAYAVWSSCLDIDSQGFRDIEDAQRPEWHNAKTRIESSGGKCLAAQKSFDDYFLKTSRGNLTATKEIFKRMKQRKDDILVSADCDEGTENEFNYLELINGDIKLVHEQTGWCVAPKSPHSDELSLKPCNKGTYMFWDPIEVGGGVILKNKEANKCLTLDLPSNGETVTKARLDNCAKSQAQTFDFLK